MIGPALVFVLALAGVLVIQRPIAGVARARVRPLWPLRRGQLLGRRSASSANEALQEASIMVAQLAALLRAGRSPHQMWAQAAQTTTGEAAAVLGAAARASAAGSPASGAIREAAGLADERDARPRAPWNSRHSVPVEVFRSVWSDVAVCIEAAEASARATALAGPKATTRILSVLPLVGLAMGALLGVDPLRVLVGTPWGTLCLVMGLALTIVGRVWSSRLVALAGAVR
jgi:tight adherence protein B